MALAVKNEVQRKVENNQEDARALVLAGLEQAKRGKVKDFDAVCNRLEKKYKDAML